MSEIGVINEQGDLGLGFDPLNEKDQKVYNENAQKESKEEKDEQK